jgi:uncharacterized membrane protein
VRPIRWFEIILLITVLAILSALIIPSDSPSPLLAIRFFFGFVFVAFIPGYCLVNILFVEENRLDLSEEVVLSVALSFGIAGLTGLFLGLSPIGIDFTSVTVSLSAIVIVLSLWAFLRKRKGELREPQVQSTDSIGK